MGDFMKKHQIALSGLLLCVTAFSSLQADAAAAPEEPMARKNSFKIRGAAFYPQGSLTRQIYGNFWPEGSIEYDYQFKKHWAAFANVAYTRKGGHSVGEGDKTTATLVPLTVGVNAKFGGSSWVHPYLGIGIGGAYAHFFNDSNFVKKHVNRGGFASIAQGGVELDFKKYFFVDLFAAYRFNWFAFNKHPHRLTGGADIGGGLGFRF